MRASQGRGPRRPAGAHSATRHPPTASSTSTAVPESKSPAARRWPAHLRRPGTTGCGNDDGTVGSTMNDVYVVGVGMTVFGATVPLGSRSASRRRARHWPMRGPALPRIDAVYAGSAHPLSPRGVHGRPRTGTDRSGRCNTWSKRPPDRLAAGMSARPPSRPAGSDTALVIGLDSHRNRNAHRVDHHRPRGKPALPSPSRCGQASGSANTAPPPGTCRRSAKNWNYARHNPFAARRAPHPGGRRTYP